MCVTDLELELDADITEDEMPDETSIIGQYAGVAWGRADRCDQDRTGAEQLGERARGVDPDRRDIGRRNHNPFARPGAKGKFGHPPRA